MCAILDPQLVVLGGGIGASPLLLRPVRGSAAALVPITARIETSLLGERAALQGAIAVALHAARTTLLSPGAAPMTHKNLVAIAPRSRSEFPNRQSAVSVVRPNWKRRLQSVA